MEDLRATFREETNLEALTHNAHSRFCTEYVVWLENKLHKSLATIRRLTMINSVEHFDEQS